MKRTIYSAIVLRPASDGKWWALNRQDQGWASFGYPYPYLGDALDAHKVAPAKWGFDQYGLYILAV